MAMAAMSAGLHPESLRRMLKQDPEMREILTSAEEMGTRRVFEGELFTRALAGPEDRGSIRALELVMKARLPEYREKQQVQMEVIHRAASAVSAAVAPPALVEGVNDGER